MRWKDERDISFTDCEAFRKDVEHNLQLIKNFVNQKSLQVQQSRQNYLQELESLNQLVSKVQELSVASSKLRHLSKKNNERMQEIEQKKDDQVTAIALWKKKIKRLESQLAQQNENITEKQIILNQKEEQVKVLEANHSGLEQKYKAGYQRLQQLGSQLNHTLEQLEKRSRSWKEKQDHNTVLNSKLHSRLHSELNSELNTELNTKRDSNIGS